MKRAIIYAGAAAILVGSLVAATLLLPPTDQRCTISERYDKAGHLIETATGPCPVPSLLIMLVLSVGLMASAAWVWWGSRTAD